MPARDYPQFTNVTFHARFLRPGQVTEPYTECTYSLVEKLIIESHDQILHNVELMVPYRDRLLELAQAARSSTDTEARFEGEFSNWDACLLYSLIRHHKPKKFIETGSGSSTRFIRQAITDGNLDTQLIVVDPLIKNAFAQTLPDLIILEHFEDVWDDPRLKLEPGDMFFYDGCHFAIPGSDLVRFCLEYVPRLPDGVWLHFHDVFPPGDGPTRCRKAMIFGEAYLAYMMLLYGKFELECSIWALRAGLQNELSKKAAEIFPPFPKETGVLQYGGSFWVRTRRQDDC